MAHRGKDRRQGLSLSGQEHEYLEALIARQVGFSLIEEWLWKGLIIKHPDCRHIVHEQIQQPHECTQDRQEVRDDLKAKPRHCPAALHITWGMPGGRYVPPKKLNFSSLKYQAAVHLAA